MKSHDKTEIRQSECPASGQPHRMAIARTTVAYWRGKIEKVMGRGGKESPSYSARIGYQKRRIRFPLHTSNKEQAAQKAARIFSSLLESGWKTTLEEFKPHTQKSIEEVVDTVGDLISVARKYSTAREKSFQAYEQAIRKIVADVFEVNGDSKNVTNARDVNKKWKEEVDKIALKDLTPTKIQAWRVVRINQSGRDAAAKRKATVTANSQIRNAKALFSKKILPFLCEELDLPSPLPFEGVQAEKVGSQRYHSRINTLQLMDDAERDLRHEHSEAYKIFTLALVCGLRVSEIDHLLWEVIDLDRCTLHVQTTEFHQLKSEDSEGILDLREKVCAYLSEAVMNAADGFVVSVSENDVAPISAKYRCQKHLDCLIGWLREKGVKEQKPIHTLRKEVGSIIASEQGIFAASRYLRHADRSGPAKRSQ